MYQIEQLSSEQIDLIPIYRQKWIAIACSNRAIDSKRVQRAICYLYSELGLQLPRTKIFHHPEKLYRAFQPYMIHPIEQIRQYLSFLGIVYILAIFGLVGWCVISTFERVIEFSSMTGVLVFSTAPIFLFYISRSRHLVSKWLLTVFAYLIGFYLLILAPFLKAWTLQANPLLAFVTGCLPVSIMPLLNLLNLLENQRLEFRWSRRIDAEISSQLSRKVQKQLTSAWISNHPLTGNIGQESSPPIGYVSILRWSFTYFSEKPSECFDTINWLDRCSYIDFCISVLGCTCNQQLWGSFQTLMSECGLILPLREYCWVCDRPFVIRMNGEGRLHAEAKAAIEYRQGANIYAWHGVVMPSHYGSYHPHQWQARWVLEEENAELRRVLIEGIGYGRLCQELNAQAINSWREYTLLVVSIPSKAYVRSIEVIDEPIYLLKMTCPSTNHIHVLRVPPNLRSARAAARWVNWDIDPQSFSVES